MILGKAKEEGPKMLSLAGLLQEEGPYDEHHHHHCVNGSQFPVIDSLFSWLVWTLIRGCRGDLESIIV